ncbi:hypothetical protein DM01DRAFT_344260, partial [Hesseltinella vesiculosa]
MATMATIESETPTTTTSDVVEFRQAVSHKLRHLTSTMAFYGSHASKARFEAKKGQQRGAAVCANIMLTGSAKYCKAKRMKAKTRKNRRRRRKLSQQKRAIKQQIVRTVYDSVDAQIIGVSNQIAVQDAAMDAIVSGIMNLDLSQNQAIHHALNAQVTTHEVMTNTLEQHRLLLKNQKEQLQQKFLELNHSPMNTVRRQYHGSQPQQQGPSLVAFGAAMIGRDGARMRGHAVGRTDVVRNHLLERQSRALTLVLHTDEYLTSQASAFFKSKACNVCGGQLSPVATNNQQGIFGLKHCTACCMFWDRDACAANNMFWAAHSTLEVGARPAPLARPAPGAPPPHHRPPLPPISLPLRTFLVTD